MESFKYLSMTSEEVLEYMKSDRQGLSQDEASARIKIRTECNKEEKTGNAVHAFCKPVQKPLL